MSGSNCWVFQQESRAGRERAALRTQLALRRSNCARRSRLGRRSVARSGADAAFLGRRGHVRPTFFHRRRDARAGRLRWSCCRAGCCSRPSLIASLVRADRGGSRRSKRAIMNMVVHAYDLFFYLSSWSTISYLWSDHRRYLLALPAALARHAWRELARLPRRQHAACRAAGRRSPCSLCILLARYGAHARGERPPHAVLLREPLRLLLLCILGRDASRRCGAARCWKRRRAGAVRRASPFRRACNAGAKPPHIILIHQESVVQPSLFPTLRYDQLGRPVLSLRRCATTPAAGGNLWRRLAG